jgi:hypothetical protein
MLRSTVQIKLPLVSKKMTEEKQTKKWGQFNGCCGSIVADHYTSDADVKGSNLAPA